MHIFSLDEIILENIFDINPKLISVNNKKMI